MLIFSSFDGSLLYHINFSHCKSPQASFLSVVNVDLRYYGDVNQMHSTDLYDYDTSCRPSKLGYNNSSIIFIFLISSHIFNFHTVDYNFGTSHGICIYTVTGLSLSTRVVLFVNLKYLMINSVICLCVYMLPVLPSQSLLSFLILLYIIPFLPQNGKGK